MRGAGAEAFQAAQIDHHVRGGLVTVGAIFLESFRDDALEFFGCVGFDSLRGLVRRAEYRRRVRRWILPGTGGGR